MDPDVIVGAGPAGGKAAETLPTDAFEGAGGAIPPAWPTPPSLTVL